MTKTKNPFDFSDLSDLPKELASRLHTETNDHAQTYADVIRKGMEAGYEELDINQIMAAAIRMGIEVPTQQTVRGYLNAGVKLGIISKPSRQTYAMGNKQAKVAKEDVGIPEDAVATAEAAPEVPEATDPLATL